MMTTVYDAIVANLMMFHLTLADVNPVTLVSRWVHVGAAVIFVGGFFFARYAFIPGLAERNTEAEHADVQPAVFGAWKRWVMIATLLLLVSGLYNYVLAVRVHKGDGLYHALMGVKMLLALAVMFLGAVITGRSPKFEGLRRSSKTWLGVLLMLAALIIGIAGFLKIRGVPIVVEEPEPIGMRHFGNVFWNTEGDTDSPSLWEGRC